MTLVLGLTGGIASGKSTVSAMFKEVGWPVIDADLIARQIVAPGSQGLDLLAKHFGTGILQTNGELNRAKLGQIVFNDPNALKQLNAIEHPLIQAEIEQQLQTFKKQKLPVVVLDIPLLFETGMDELCDQTVLVVADEATQLKRLMARNHYDQNQAKVRINSQMPLSQKMKRADILIDNNGSLMQTRAQVAKLVASVESKNL